MEKINSDYTPVDKYIKCEENSIADNSTDLEKNEITDTKIPCIPLRRPIDVPNNRYPYCIVWTPLPLISWIIPIIGHTGICTYIYYKNLALMGKSMISQGLTI